MMIKTAAFDLLDMSKFFKRHGEQVPNSLVGAVYEVSELLDEAIEEEWDPEIITIERFKQEQLTKIFKQRNLTDDQTQEYVSTSVHAQYDLKNLAYWRKKSVFAYRTTHTAYKLSTLLPAWLLASRVLGHTDYKSVMLIQKDV